MCEGRSGVALDLLGCILNAGVKAAGASHPEEITGLDTPFDDSVLPLAAILLAREAYIFSTAC